VLAELEKLGGLLAEAASGRQRTPLLEVRRVVADRGMERPYVNFRLVRQSLRKLFGETYRQLSLAEAEGKMGLLQLLLLQCEVRLLDT
jgi:hypothetical protein